MKGRTTSLVYNMLGNLCSNVVISLFVDRFLPPKHLLSHHLLRSYRFLDCNAHWKGVLSATMAAVFVRMTV